MRLRYLETANDRRLCEPNIEVEQEQDGRWIAEVLDIPGILAYGRSREDAVAQAQALALRVLAERIEHGEAIPLPSAISFLAA